MDKGDLAIEIQNLSFDFGGPLILKDITMKVNRGSRCLLVGANGAGKSTLLRIIAGKHLVKANVCALGKNTFQQITSGITYLGTEWANNPVVRRDVSVSRLLKTLGAKRNQTRCSELLEIMDVDPNWHMHQISDGQRRRVQIVLGLLEPWDLLLLDEVTVDLDVLVRQDLLNFLKRETEERKATILYATHIFDGLDGWATHIAHMSYGRIVDVIDLSTPLPLTENETARGSILLRRVEKWLREDKAQEKKNQVENVPPLTKWDILSENMKEFGDKYYNYWHGEKE